MSPPAKRWSPPHRQRGLVLVIVLWTLALLMVVATEFAYSTRTEARLARNVVDTARARYLAEAGVARGIYALSHPDPQRRWRTDGTVYRFPLPPGEVRVAVHDESGFIDLNTASAGLLDGLLRVAGIEDSARPLLIDAILDWRDADSLRRLHGVEDPDYRRAGMEYGAKDAPFDSVTELLLVPGVSPALYRRVEPWLTVHTAASVNTHTAPREVLLALPGADAGQVDALIASRSETDTQRASPNHTYRLVAEAHLPSGVRATLRAVFRIETARAGATQVSVLEWHAQ